MIQQVAASHGLRAEVDPSLPFPDMIVQAAETDLALLRRLALLTDSAFRVDGTSLQFHPVDSEESALLTLDADRDLLEYRVRVDLAGQRRGVEVRGWDPSAKQAIVERPAPGSVGSPPSPLGHGPEELERSWGWGAAPMEPSVTLGPATPDEARDWAGAWARSIGRGFVELRGTVGPGPPWIRPGRPLDLTELGSTFQGRYRVVACRHHWDSQGFRTEFRAFRRVP